MNDEDRISFERWISRAPFEKDVSRWGDDASKYGWPGNYMTYEVQLAWEAWEAALSLERNGIT